MNVALQVPDAYIEGLDLVPDVDKGHLDILVHGNAAAKGLKVGNLSLIPHPLTHPSTLVVFQDYSGSYC